MTYGVKAGRVRLPILFAAALAAALAFVTVVCAESAEIGNLAVLREGSNVSVSAELRLGPAQIRDLEGGLQKEIIFFVDLFRVWEFWPDEFIAGIRSARTIKSDPVKKEFMLISVDGRTTSELRFNSLDSLLDRALKVQEVQVFSTDRLEPGEYYVKVTAVSQIRRLAPIVGYLLFFVPEKEFTVELRSGSFSVGVRP